MGKAFIFGSTNDLLDVHEVVHDTSRLLGPKTSVQDLICLHLLLIYLADSALSALPLKLSLNICFMADGWIELLVLHLYRLWQSYNVGCYYRYYEPAITISASEASACLKSLEEGAQKLYEAKLPAEWRI